MKYFSVIFCILWFSNLCYSQTVDIDVAKNVGANLLSSTSINSLKSANFKKSKIKLNVAYSAVDNKDTLYYILNDSVNNAFVIVSADDRVWPVLGYSTQGTFDGKKQPDAFRAILEQWSKEIAYIKTNNLKPEQKITEQWNQLKSGTIIPTSSIVEPMLKTTWDQWQYYNDLCPVIDGVRTPTGCTATAMAQIMKFWNYPESGKGSLTYNHYRCGDLTADFGSTKYLWSNMSDRLTQPNSEVARLMFHCGVASRMDYRKGGSGAYCNHAVNSLVSFFNYSDNHGTTRKQEQDNKLWISALKREIDGGKPILVSAYTDTIGHAFIIDGYSDELYFHYNWGWRGASDGYFITRNLHDKTQIYNDAQEAFLNICPNEMPNGFQGLYATASLLNINTDLDSAKFRVVSSVKWSAVSDQSWLKLSQSAGLTGVSEITITADENTTTLTRKATIRISTAEFGTKTVTVCQPHRVTVTAGQLMANLGNRSDTIRYLSLNGTIDARDFKTMRDKMPFLVKLDLKNASIVKYIGPEGTNENGDEVYLENTIPRYSFNKIVRKINSIQDIIFPKDLKTIDELAFYGCDELKRVRIPAPVDGVKSNAFRHCTSLSSLELSSSVKSFEGIPFDSQYLFFEEINVDLANLNYSSAEGVLFNKNKTSILIYPCEKLGKTYAIPNTIKTIVDGVFSNNKYLRTIFIPPSVDNIAQFAFINCNAIPVADEKSPHFYSSDSLLFNKAITKTVFCSKLKRGKYIIPSTIKTIGAYSFANTRLDSIVMPNSLTTIEQGAFNCSSIRHAVIPPSVTTIGINAFSFCMKLKSVTIPKSVTKIESNAFASNYDCKLSTIICLNPIPPDLGGMVFSYVDTYNCKLYVPKGAASVYKKSYSDWSSFRNIIELPNNPPVAHAGFDQSISENTKVTLDGTTSSDPDGQPLTYKWIYPEGITLSFDNTSKPTFIAPEVTEDKIFKFSLVVSDGSADSSIDEVVITVKNVNKAPIANVVVDQSASEGATVSLDGSLSSDLDGNQLTYKWTAPAGITLSSTTAAKPTFTAPEVRKDTTLSFTLVVNDGYTNSQPATVKITVLNVVKVGINDQKLHAFNIFPNPTTGIINLEISGEKNNVVEISVCNMIGAEVFRRKTRNQERLQIDISNQVSGIYTLKVIGGDQQFINKIILRKE